MNNVSNQAMRTYPLCRRQESAAITSDGNTATLNTCAYLLGGTVPHFNAGYSDENPQVEFLEFMRRNETIAYDYSALSSLDGMAFRRLLRQKHQFVLSAAQWRKKHDVSITSGEDIGILCALTDLLTGSRKPLVIITHGSYFGSTYFRFASRLLRHQKHVHWACLSQSLAKTMVDDFGFSASQVHATGYGVDTDYFRPSGEATAGPMILAAGTANRDYLSLVSAIDGLDVNLRIAADSAWYPVKTDVADISLPSNVTVSSAGNYLGLRDLYAASSFVVVPMHHAKFACGYAVMIEAMAMGKVVIATRTDAISDFLVDGENGFLVDIGDVAVLRSKICYLLENPEVAIAMGERARRDIETHWTLSKYSARLEAAVNAASAHR